MIIVHNWRYWSLTQSMTICTLLELSHMDAHLILEGEGCSCGTGTGHEPCSSNTLVKHGNCATIRPQCAELVPVTGRSVKCRILDDDSGERHSRMIPRTTSTTSTALLANWRRKHRRYAQESKQSQSNRYGEDEAGELTRCILALQNS